MTSAPAATAMHASRLEVQDAPLTRPPAGAPRHAFTVDVEDWYQSCLDYDAPITERVVAERRPDPRRPRRVRRERDVLRPGTGRGDVSATRRLARRRRATRSSRTATATGRSPRWSRVELRDELERAKKTVEDAAGTAVTAFRAQDFSILQPNLWAIETLADVGFEVDSSIFPMRSRHYGIAGWRVEPHYLAARGGGRTPRGPRRDLARSEARVPGRRRRLLPTAPAPGARAWPPVDRGRGPARRSSTATRTSSTRDELDEYPDVSWRLRASQGLGRGSFGERVRTLLPKFAFGRLDEVLDGLGARLNVAFLTTDDPLYLPDFFERVLASPGRTASPSSSSRRSTRTRPPAARRGATSGRSGSRRRRPDAPRRRRQAPPEVDRARLRVPRRPCESVSDVNDPEFLDRLRSLGTELIVSVSCPQIFKEPLIDLPPLGCLNIHGAILPQYRGVMPSFWMLAHGEAGGRRLRSSSSTRTSTRASSAGSASSRSGRTTASTAS